MAQSSLQSSTISTSRSGNSDNVTAQGTLVLARCLCGQIQETLHVPKPLPVDSTTCSCNTCRYSTGQIFLTSLPLSCPPACIDRMQNYGSSSKLTRYFCGRCGSHMFLNAHKYETWTVCAGVVDQVEGSIRTKHLSIQCFRAHEFVGDTRDGGLTLALPQLGTTPASFFMRGPDEEPVTKTQGSGAQSSGKSGILDEPLGQNADKLIGACHCGGVQFFVTRPSEVSSKCTSPWPDLIKPDYLGNNSNPENSPWWLRMNGTRYLAGTCACRSCRLGAGNPIQSWAFVPKANIFNADGSPLDFSRRTLRRIESSPGAYREFCSVCGATVFWHCDVRPDLIDVSVGVLRAEEGSRAESWLEWWTERLSFAEEALDTVLAKTFEQGLRRLSAV